MIAGIWIILVLINLFFSITNKKNKFILIITILLTVLLIGGNNDNADYRGYLYYYNNQIYPSSMEIGYTGLSALFHNVGLDYQFLVAFIVSVSILIFCMVANYYKINGHTAACLYLVTMIFLDAVQIRQFFAYSMFTLAIMFLSKRKKMLSVVCIVFASLFQQTALFFLPLVLLDSSKRLKKRTARIIIFCILTTCLFVFVNGNTISVLTPLIERIVSGQKLVYFETKTRFGFILYFAFQMICMYLSYVCRETLKENNADSKYISFVNNTCMASIYSSFAMPFVMINNNFSRFFKYPILCYFIIIDYIIYPKNNQRTIIFSRNVRGRKNAFVLLVVVYIIIYELAIQVPSVIIDVLSHNIFF